MFSPPQASIWFSPEPGNARVLCRQLIHRLAGSLDELIEACRAAVPLDDAAITRQVKAIRAASTVPPSVWLHYASALEAVRQDDPDALAAALLELAAVDLSTSQAVRNFRDTTLPTAMWDRYQGALAIDASASVSLRPAPEQEFGAANAHLAVARAQLKAADPALADEISVLIQEVVFARGEVQPGVEFGGSDVVLRMGCYLPECPAASQRGHNGRWAGARGSARFVIRPHRGPTDRAERSEGAICIAVTAGCAGNGRNLSCNVCLCPDVLCAGPSSSVWRA